MSAEHTPSPFAHRFDQLATYENGRTPLFLLEADYNRARACWDACERIPTDLLEQHAGVVPAMVPYWQLQAQRDELLAALKGVVRVADRATVEFDAARAAIAKAEAAAAAGAEAGV